MRPSFDISVPLRFLKHAKPTNEEGETLQETPKSPGSRRRSIQDFFKGKANASRLPKRLRKQGKRRASVRSTTLIRNIARSLSHRPNLTTLNKPIDYWNGSERTAKRNCY